MTAKPFCDGPFSILKGTNWIVGKDKDGNYCHVLDQRGWGYLTGKGHTALGLDTATASAMLAETQQWVVDAMNAAWNRRADLAAVQPAQVRAKPLVWEDRTGSIKSEATSIVGPYEVCQDGAWIALWFSGVRISGALVSIEAAKAAAMADYEARILAALEPLPDQTVEIDLRVAMMEELEKAASESLWVPEEYYMNEVISDCCAFLRSDRSQPAPRDEVIKGLVDALCEAMIVPEAWYISGFPNISVDAIDQTKRAVPLARAALAAAKAVQK